MGASFSCEPPTYQVVVLGGEGSGKTSLIRKFLGKLFQVMPATFSEIYLRKSPGGNLRLVEIGGARKNEAIWETFFEDSDALLWVIPIGDYKLESESEEQHRERIWDTIKKSLELLGSRVLKIGFKDKPVYIALNFADRWKVSYGEDWDCFYLKFIELLFNIPEVKDKETMDLCIYVTAGIDSNDAELEKNSKQIFLDLLNRIKEKHMPLINQLIFSVE